MACTGPGNIGPCASWDGFSPQARCSAAMEQTAHLSTRSTSRSAAASRPTPRASLTKIASFLCPSDGNAGPGAFLGWSLNSDNSNTNSYLGLDRHDLRPRRQRPGGHDQHRAVLLSGRYGIRDCTDGSSNTIAFAEGLVGAPNSTAYRGQRRRRLGRPAPVGRQERRRLQQRDPGHDRPPGLHDGLEDRARTSEHARLPVGLRQHRLHDVQHHRPAQLQALSLERLHVLRRRRVARRRRTGRTSPTPPATTPAASTSCSATAASSSSRTRST